MVLEFLHDFLVGTVAGFPCIALIHFVAAVLTAREAVEDEEKVEYVNRAPRGYRWPEPMRELTEGRRFRK